MKLSKMIMVTSAMLSLSSGALASSHYDGGCTQLHFAEDVQAASSVKTELPAAVVPNPIVEGAGLQANTEANADKLQQARFQHHETAGAVDCDLDAIEE